MKRTIAFKSIIVIMISLFIVSCNNNDEVKEFVKSSLAMLYRGELLEYSKITGLEENKVENIYLRSLEIEAKAFESYFDIRNIATENRDEIIEIYKSIYSQAKYEVSNVSKVDNSYLVEVFIYPINIINGAKNDVSLFIDEFNKKTKDGEFDNLNDEEFEKEYAEGITKIIYDHMSNLEYGKKETITVKVLKDKDGKCTIDDDEISKIDKLIINY